MDTDAIYSRSIAAEIMSAKKQSVMAHGPETYRVYDAKPSRTATDFYKYTAFLITTPSLMRERERQ